MSNLVEIENLRIAFRNDEGGFNDAVRGVSLTLGREKLGIVGESGSGKSLTGRALLGVLPPYARVSVDRMTFDGSALPKGNSGTLPANLLYTVTEIYPEHVVLDGNHPLAGIGLRLALTVHGVREATEEEVGRGTAGTGFFRVQPSAPSGPDGGLLH